MSVISRLAALVLLFWAFGFVYFATSLPGPMGETKTDAIIVPTGGGGRIPRGLELLDKGQSKEMLVTGVDPEVKPREFAAEYSVRQRQMNCCVTLGYEAVDTRGNAREAANWVVENKFKTLRLVTTDWHMRRAELELQRALPDDVAILADAVPSKTSLGTLFLEYHKYLAAYVAPYIGQG